MDAISFTGATCSLTSLYQRVNRFRKRKAEEELADTASYEIKRGGTGFGVRGFTAVEQKMCWRGYQILLRSKRCLPSNPLCRR